MKVYIVMVHYRNQISEIYDVYLIKEEAEWAQVVAKRETYTADVEIEEREVIE